MTVLVVKKAVLKQRRILVEHFSRALTGDRRWQRECVERRWRRDTSAESWSVFLSLW